MGKQSRNIRSENDEYKIDKITGEVNCNKDQLNSCFGKKLQVTKV